MMKMSKETQSATTQELEKISTIGPLVSVDDYGEDEGRGFEHQTAADGALPWLVMLQSKSPAVENEEHPDAKAGAWMDTVAKKIYPRGTPVEFVPATTRHLFAKWVPRLQGGGFRGHELPESDVVRKAVQRATEFGKYTNDEGLQLVETYYVYGVLCEAGVPVSMAVIPFTSMKIAPYRSWMQQLRQFSVTKGGVVRRPPLYAHTVAISCKADSNAKGSFYVPEMKPWAGSIAASLISKLDPRYVLGKQCADLVDSGEAKVDFSKSEQVENSSDTPF